MTVNGSFTHQDQYKTDHDQYAVTANPTDTTTKNVPEENHDKDQVGWCFVERYYTTLSQKPEKLHLFYSQNSQFVFGLETDVTPVSVGREAIQERIKGLQFLDTKVRVTNVDTQTSYDCILVQVIGEISRLSAEPVKFVQTFVLAQQQNGYFVLNDIFRYINEEVLDEEATESKPEDITLTKSHGEDSETLAQDTTTNDHNSIPLDVETADAKLRDVSESEEPANQKPLTTNDTSIRISPNPEETLPTVNNTANDYGTETVEASVKAEPKEFEKPQAISQAPAAESHINYTNEVAVPVQPAGTLKPLSWASRAAAALGSTPKPAVPVVAPKTSGPAQSRTAPSKNVPETNTSPNLQTDKEKSSVPIGTGWQTAGENPKKQNKPQSISAAPEKDGTMGYVRNVTEKVEIEELRAVLSSFGGLVYFDVNRVKNCAFVEFATAEGYQAANKASPHQVSGEPIFVEPRRPRSNAYGGNGFSGGRGGINQRSRGGYSNRGRGANSNSRPRGQVNNS